jgi:protein-tyrosine phosphatase
MAELMLAQAFDEAGLADAVTVDSAGTSAWEVGNSIDPRAARKLAEYGIDAVGHRARKFKPGWFQERDLILALDVDHFDQLRSLAPDDEARGKIRMLRGFDPSVAGLDPADQGIEDPWYGDMRDFDNTWALISASVPGIVAHVKNVVSQKALDGHAT